MSQLRATFFKDGAVDRVEIKIVGDPNTIILKVEPEHAAQFPKEWEAYQAGQENVDHGGTPLTDVPGISGSMQTAYRFKGIHNAEQLAAISDSAMKTLGLGGDIARKSAKLLLASNELEALKALTAKSGQGEPKKRGRPAQQMQ